MEYLIAGAGAVTGAALAIVLLKLVADLVAEAFSL